MKQNLKICVGPSCTRSHAREILSKARKCARATDTEINECSCMGLCPNAPVANLNGKIITDINPTQICQLLGDPTSKQTTHSNPNLADAQLDSIEDLLNP